jgi:hypothetical protein
MPHTAASWLVQDGVPLYDVQHLLWHEDYPTTRRYAHLAPDAHSKVMESWPRRLDAAVTHGQKEPVPHEENRASDPSRGGRLEPAASSSRTERIAVRTPCWAVFAQFVSPDAVTFTSSERG